VSNIALSKDGTKIGYLSDQNLREWREIASGLAGLAAILPHSETKGFPDLDHFGIERTASREVAKAVSDHFLK
jgi:hypothetical protein